MSSERALTRFAQAGAAAARRGALTLRRAWRALPGEVRGECAMAVNRLIAGTLVLAATVASVAGHGGRGRGDLTFPHWRVAIGGWLVLAFILFVHVLTWPRPHALRRSIAMVLDIAGASIVLHASGAAAAFIYPVYLWIIVGNGLRFGGRYLLAASLLSIFGFGVVIATTPFWRAELRLTAGLMAGLIVLPAYLYFLVRRVASARAAAEQANRTKTLFLAGVSHELRTPLNAITGMAEILGGTELDRDQASMVATIDASADALLSLIEGLLDVSRIEAGQVRVCPVAFDLARLLADVHRIVGVPVAAKNLRLNTFITARTPLSLCGDAARLREILLSLCANAVKFTAEGSITIAVDGEAEEGRVRLRAEVTDTGIGIEPAAQRKIFDMFTQADESIGSRFGGTGIGLAICDRLVHLLGGELGVASAPGRGSTFWLTIPMESGPEPDGAPTLDVPMPVVVAADPEQAAPLAARLRACGLDAQVSRPAAGTGEFGAPLVAFVDPDAGPAFAGALAQGCVAVLVQPFLREGLPTPEVRERFVTAIDPFGSDGSLRRAVRIAAARLPATQRTDVRSAPGLGASGVRVLVADDNAVNRKVVTKILEHAGHEVVTADDGEQALDVLSDGAVDAAILDVNMPLLTGIEVARLHLYSAPLEARIPVVGLTADGTSETSAQCRAAGMAACLVKPLRSAALLDALDEALASRERDRRAREPVPWAPPSAARTLDLQALADLAEVGGEVFVAGVVRDFIEDAERTIAHLQEALAADDLAEFRAQAHALCSSAANVGACGLRELCDPWQTISAVELEQTGPSLLQLLRGEWARSRAALLERAA
jgi:two-component system, sensor histidine kinase RpfC